MRRGVWWTLLALTLIPGLAAAYEQHSGTFSAGLQGHISALLGANASYDTFRWRGNFFKGESVKGPGAGLAVRLRISLDRVSALGLSFEALSFKRSLSRNVLADFEEDLLRTYGYGDTLLVDKLHVTAVSVDYYRYFMRRKKTTPYAVGGLGFFRPERRFGDYQTKILKTGAFVTLGGGLEHFFTRGLSLEPSLRIYAMQHDGGISTAAELALGIRFYHLVRRTGRP